MKTNPWITMTLYNVYYPEDLLPHETYDIYDLDDKANRIIIRESDLPDTVEGITFVRNAIPVYAVQEKWDTTLLAEEACHRFSMEFPKDPASVIRDLGNDLFSRCHKFLFTPEKSDKKYILTIPNDSIDLYIIHKKRLVFVADTKEVVSTEGIIDIGWSFLPCGNDCYTDDYDAIVKMVEVSALPEAFIEKWNKDHSLFHAQW